MWEDLLNDNLINSNESTFAGTTTTEYYKGDFIQGSSLPKDKEIGEIPTNTHVYERIIKYWITHKLDTRINLYKDVRADWAGKIIIVEGAATPIEYWNDIFTCKNLYVSQGWLKYFISSEELAELTAIRMLGDDK